MYKLIVVDDEDAIRTGIVEGNDWNAIGFEVVGTASNGVQALDLIRITSPDVILTDIKMPVMDGLVLIEKVRNEFPSIKCVVLSGYNEFEYVQSALKNKAVEYLLKPTDVKEFSLTFERIAAELDSEKKLKYEYEVLRKQVRDSFPLLKEKFLNELVRGCSYDAGIINEKIKYFNLQLDINGGRVILIEIDALLMDRDKYTEDDKNLYIFAVKNIIEEITDGRLSGICFTGYNEIIILCNNIYTNDVIQKIILDMQEATRKFLQLTISAGIGRTYKSIRTIPVSLSEAKEALKYKIYTGDESIIFIDDVHDKAGNLEMPDDLEKERISDALLSDNDGVLEEAIDCIFERLVDGSLKPLHFIDNLCLDILFTSIKYMENYNARGARLFEQVSFKEIFECDSINAKKQCLKTIIKRIKKQMKDMKYTSIRKVVCDIKDYIDMHYHEQNLSLNLVADRFNKSSVYISKLFKAEIGENFIDYVTRLRIEKAKQLLTDSSNMKAFEISQLVGYMDVSHFSKLFKKHVGASPIEYRERKNIKNAQNC